MPIPHAAPRRLALSYSVEGLSVRDDLLLKSLVRVLDHRSHQQWQCLVQGGDLRVSGAPFGSSAADGQGGLVLRMGHPPGEGEFALPMPLHAGHLENMFNRIGDHIAQQRADAAASAAQQPVRDDEQFRLRRWPPAALLGTPERLSLAALMSARPQPLAVLQRQSGVPLPLCIEFLRELRQADLVLSSPVPATLPADAAPAAEPDAAARPAVAVGAAAPQPGLIARIRARFGLQPAWSR
ncbi:hypothetical protein [Xenophilus sp. Marseille-Q4582]|uniref:hypothetical protein n=1 Tax=Xenophilus sp. Marseille-Q4582 TaxID=2866600 RepID=UPI001CE46F7B|nr:hypothetical protein [Xenophilus sp. Marseille-Q4582]